MYAIDVTNCIILYKYLATCFDQFCGHNQAIQTHKIKIALENFILGQNEVIKCDFVFIFSYGLITTT